MTEGNRTDDLVKDFERVVKKAIDANTVYYREAAAALQDLYSGKTSAAVQHQNEAEGVISRPGRKISRHFQRIPPAL
jgi:hypothetical protein